MENIPQKLSLLPRFVPLVHRLLKPAPAWVGHDEGERSGKGIAEDEHEEHDHRLCSYDDEEQNGKDQEGERLPFEHFRVFEGIVAETGNHEKGEGVNENQYRKLLVRTGPAEAVEEKDGCGNH